MGTIQLSLRFILILIFSAIGWLTLSPCYALNEKLSKPQPVLLSDIQEKIGLNKKIVGQFTQKRFVKELDVTLTSTGIFRLDDNKNLLWHQQKPVEYKFTIENGTSKLKLDGGGASDIPDNNPIVKLIIRLIQNIMAGQFSAVEKQFEIKTISEPNLWTINMQPHDQALKKLISLVVIKGSQYINSVQITDIQKNIITIQFTLNKGT